jgi:RNA polymerase sigma factor (TIGR02999 family)
LAQEGHGQITRLLAHWAQGDRGALDLLMPMVYRELHEIAGRYLRNERSGHTLQPTALVHEAWLRLVKQDPTGFDSRKQFLALAARLMRQILVDHARGVRAGKRGGGAVKTTLPGALDYSPDRADEFLALDEAIERLARASPRKAQVIELRYFGGLNVEEMAEFLGVSIATISREQRMAEAWLGNAMEG